MVKSFANALVLRRTGAAALAGVMALSMLAVSAPQAEARDGRNTALAAGAAVGLAAGALLGAAAANSGPDYIAPPPAYYPPPPPYPVYGGPVYGGPVYYAPPPVPRCYMSPIQRWDPYVGQYVVVGHQQMCN
ncbi:hypothetical protein [Pannonibacter tanglangensis]|uniref:hypothetical protein n=1 Tax=Pannonibacter tanglangensis TaxID=2750084 RepID=UPI0015D0FD34|nr:MULTISPECIES: hypothetical protein [unclassified Pannonibacter]